MLSTLITSGSIVFISLLFGFALLVIWWHYKLPRHVALWAASFVAAAIGHGLRISGGVLHGEEELFATLACHASVGSFTLLAWGFRSRDNLRSRGVFWCWALVTVVLLWAWFHHDASWRALSRFMTALGDVTMVGWTVATLWHRRGVGALARWVMLTYGLYIVGVAVAAGLARPGGMISNQVFIDVLSIGTPTGMIGTGIMTLLVVAMDINRGLRTEAQTDSLTGLLNRRGVEEKASRLIADIPGATPVTVVIADLDHFKRVNDLLGHAGGDDVLQRFAAHLHGQLRPEDVAGRTGGEEFVLLLPRTAAAEALVVVERVRQSVALAFNGDEPVGAMTASFGIAEVRFGETFAAAVRRADVALYQSKREGRDRTTLASV